MLPSKIQDALSFKGRFSSGVAGSTIRKFTPLTTETQGRVLKAKLSGLSMLQLDYLGRLTKTFSFGAETSYFVLSDLDYAGYPGADGHFLGLEGYARAIWAPVSDIRLSFGGGAFFPQLGNAGRSAGIQWLADFNLVISLF